MELGHGGMGQVFLAKKGQMLGIDRYCVIKTLHAEHSDKSEYLGRFLDEARLAVNLNHRNIFRELWRSHPGKNFRLTGSSPDSPDSKQRLDMQLVC